MQEQVSFYAVSERALTISFGEQINRATNDAVFKLHHLLSTQTEKFWIDIIPAYCTLTIIYDPTKLRSKQLSAFNFVKTKIESLLEDSSRIELPQHRTVRIPVCYEHDFAPDLSTLSKEKKLTEADVVRLHTQATYCVYMLGFLPGFAYMGSVHPTLITPRLAKPRSKVAAGSVGIAGGQTGIYPFESPGGWNIIGRTPLRLFNDGSPQPTLLQPHDQVNFISITMDEFREIENVNHKNNFYES